LLAADRRGSRAGVWISKPLASSGFVAAALAAGALEGRYGQAVLCALVLCWIGDLLLIPDDERSLRAGVLSFLAGHLAFLAAFALRGLEPRAALAALAMVSVPALVALRWLWPHVPGPLRPAVVAYVAVISSMVAGACGTYGVAPDRRILAGALAFFVSDLSVARDRFVAPSFANRAWGLPLYYAAELSFAASTGP
jgi:uncharacterized membrane protein YhhN